LANLLEQNIFLNARLFANASFSADLAIASPAEKAKHALSDFISKNASTLPG
jgi:hypothetical protein